MLQHRPVGPGGLVCGLVAGAGRGVAGCWLGRLVLDSGLAITMVWGWAPLALPGWGWGWMDWAGFGLGLGLVWVGWWLGLVDFLRGFWRRWWGAAATVTAPCRAVDPSAAIVSRAV